MAPVSRRQLCVCVCVCCFRGVADFLSRSLAANACGPHTRRLDGTKPQVEYVASEPLMSGRCFRRCFRRRRRCSPAFRLLAKQVRDPAGRPLMR